jgi:hypothetical protein
LSAGGGALSLSVGGPSVKGNVSGRKLWVLKEDPQVALNKGGLKSTPDGSALQNWLRACYTKDAACAKGANVLKAYSVGIAQENVNDFLGVIKFRDTLAHEKSEIGLVTGVVGMLTIGLVLFQWRAEPRRWVRRLGFVALAAVILQGVLGGLTVLYFLPAPISIGVASVPPGNE